MTKKNFIQSIISSDHVIAVSDYTKNKAELISGETLIETIPNFVNMENFFLVDKKNLDKNLGAMNQIKSYLPYHV